MKRTIFVLACLLTGPSIAGAQTSVSIGIQIGPPPPPRVVYVAPPPRPEPEYVWVDGYWYPEKHHYVWHEGYWTRPPYPGALWVPSRYDGRVFYVGYWDGPRGRVVHDHHSDGDHDRDHKGPAKRRGKH